MSHDAFTQIVQQHYAVEGASLPLGGAMIPELPPPYPSVQLVVKNFNRHGLIAGATGTGKTKTLQGLAGGLSEQGVPVLLMDIKGDLSGLAEAGTPHPKIDQRQQKLGNSFQPRAYPVELFSLSREKGIRLRATVSEFGPLLLSKMMGFNETQQGVLAVLFEYCDQRGYPLVDIADLKSLLIFAQEEGKEEIEQQYGRLSSASLGAMLRKISELVQQGGGDFFGEPSLDIFDIIRQDANQEGVISIVRLSDIQDRPQLYSTFMLGLLAELYNTLPEVGDQEKPKLVLFLDEAHVLFKNASRALLDQLEYTVKLIRSKGVGLVFCTQRPDDIPEIVLSQLGFKIQHALRAFTAKDRKSIRASAQNYPPSEYYEISELLTQLGVGEALVTALDEKGVPTPVVHTLLQAPRSRMGVLSIQEIDRLVTQSPLRSRYEQSLDRHSAHEILQQRMQEIVPVEVPKPIETPPRDREPLPPSWLESLSENTMVRQLGRTLVREITRSILGTLSTKRRR